MPFGNVDGGNPKEVNLMSDFSVNRVSKRLSI